ncbi:hypothetical protein Y032_0069g388 [Ancylostoma ceylanicum]|uniref:Uncharacterized protein n=1 Tax=Ancylostoma ceylanicum TaxID=53326 RepID=A0A016TZJ7_9BILA|nr:hypothetical protein Y032_0069g388 [Ancylostoma ceylanicum]
MLSALRRLPQHGLQRISVGRLSISASNNAADTFYHKDLQIKEAKPDQRRPLPKEGDQLGFGALFSDHMLETDYTGSEWTKPIIHPYGNFSIDPASKVSDSSGMDRGFLLKKIDGLRVRFLSVASAPSRRDLTRPSPRGILSPHPSFGPRRDGADAQSVHLFEKDCIYGVPELMSSR